MPAVRCFAGVETWRAFKHDGSSSVADAIVAWLLQLATGVRGPFTAKKENVGTGYVVVVRQDNRTQRIDAGYVCLVDRFGSVTSLTQADFAKQFIVA